MASFLALRKKSLPTTPAIIAPEAVDEPDSKPVSRDGDVMDLVEEDIRRSRARIDQANLDMGRLIDEGGSLSSQVVGEAEALSATITRAVEDVDALAAAFGEIEDAGRGITAEVGAATQLAHSAQDGARRAGEDVSDLRGAIARIETVVGLIAKVAKQTNLLALNATIEAERAGPLGRGFAVVASEVKVLSTETQRATDEISRTIASLQSAAERSGRTVEEVIDVIDRITPTFASVAAAVDLQGSMIATAADRADHVRRFVDGVSTRAETMRGNSARASDAVSSVRSAAKSLADMNIGSLVRLTTVLRQSPSSDRRRFDRFPATIPVVLSAVGRSVRSETIDLSLGGILARKTDLAISPGQTVDVELTGVGRISARLAANSDFGHHLAFDDLPDPMRGALAARVSVVQAEYQPLIDRAVQTASRISSLFEEAVQRGEVSSEQLFDTDYRPVPGTNPQQFQTAALPFLTRVLRPLQEALLTQDGRMVFCAAVDRNGYLPVHNLVFSQQQRPDDPVWNAANCRNMRIFDDRTGLLAARNTRPFIVQAYSRDMGGGLSVLMKEVDAPITINGRHWGGFRTAYKF